MYATLSMTEAPGGCTSATGGPRRPMPQLRSALASGPARLFVAPAKPGEPIDAVEARA
jgi:hypothetical protein